MSAAPTKKPYWIRPATEEALAAPLRGSCMFCKTTFRGTAHEVITAQAAHRDTCEARPAHTKPRVRNSSYNRPIPPGVVQLISDLGKQGISAPQIADELTARGTVHPNGKVWSRHHIISLYKKYPDLPRRRIRGPLTLDEQKAAA
jgi:hypothetical protein